MLTRGIIFFALIGIASAFPDHLAPKSQQDGPHWAFQIPQVLEVKEGVHPIDQLLVKSDLSPVAEAPRQVLLRRAWHVITGLLPTPQESEFWLNDPRTGEDWMRALSEAALSQKIYGERWARHWLDVARYADTKGAAITEDENFPYAYTYRDWVIGAFNRDLPFDRFAHLQIAADLLDAPKSDLAALGFLNLGRGYQGGQRHLVIADQIDVTMRGFMGLTVACARCHDHKSDPIPTADFYSLYAVFQSSSMPRKLPIISEPDDSQGFRDFEKKRHELAREVHEHVQGIVPEYKIPVDIFDFEIGSANSKLNQKGREKYRRLVGEIGNLEASSLFAPARAMTLVEGKPRQGVIHVRGNHRVRGEKVPRRFLEILREGDEVFQNGTGRLELAHRLTDDRNPLTARVWANRVWMHLMGTPLVDSPGDFGVECDSPFQLAVLDYLALTLIEKDWSTKALITHIMTSQAWRRSSQAPAQHFEIDPENRFFARANRQRKELEAWRDSALQVSGRLDLKMGGLPVEIDASPYLPRRTIYGRIRRGYLPALMRAFDFPGSEEATMRRSETITPMQALYLMNSPFLHSQARALVGKSDSVEEIYQAIFQRSPTKNEKGAAVSWLKDALPARTTGAWDYGYLLDESREFKSLPTYKNKRWSGGAKMPDPLLGHLNWNPGGGHPELDKAVVASWTSPSDFTLRLEGILHVPSENGNGVRARLMKPDGTLLGEWTALPKQKSSTKLAKISIKKGEQLWCVVDSRGDQSFDGFHWQPKFLNDEGEVTHAKNDFCRRGLRPLAQLAQALLLSNEFFYLD